MLRKRYCLLLSLGLLLAACGGSNTSSSSSNPSTPGGPSGKPPAGQAQRVVFFLGDGMGITTQTAARIYSVGESGDLTMDTLPETAFLKTFSHNSQVTDSAASMSAYMTGVKPDNEVVAMSADTKAVPRNPDYTAPPSSGKAVTSLFELAAAAGRGTGVITTSSMTDATPAACYSHSPQRDAEADIAAQLVPGGKGYNAALGSGLDLAFGGGSAFFLPTASGGRRQDGRDLTAELVAKGYAYADTRAEYDALKPGQRAVALFSGGTMAYDLDRDPAKEPSLAEMSVKAVQMLSGNPNGFLLMVEGGRIDHALHANWARRALQDTVAFDNAIKATLDELRKADPSLSQTLVVVTADHDHTLELNGEKLTGPTTATNPGILGLAYSEADGSLLKDADGMPYTILNFGTGSHRVQGKRSSVPPLTDAQAFAPDYRQESAIPTKGESHGGTDVWLGAIGHGAEAFRGTLDNTSVYTLVKQAAGL